MKNITAIVPCFNNELSIERAIDSIYNQTWQPAKVIIIDDCSTDSSKLKIKNLARKYGENWITSIFLDKNKGAANARNTGWDLATTDYIAFLDADDTWHEKKIEIQLSWMQKNAHVDLTGHAIAFKENKNTDNFKKNDFKKISKKYLLLKNFFPTPTVILKRDIPNRFNSLKRYSEDYLLWLEIAFNDYNCYFSKNYLANVYKPLYGFSGLSSHLKLMQIEELRNFKHLKNKKLISKTDYLLFTFLSKLKYIKRLTVTKLKSK